MIIPEITDNIINKIEIDGFKRVNSILLINKPKGKTSHDMVDKIRKIFRTRKVGHAGALDPFASGLLVLLVGKYTKYTQALINLDKTYKSGVVFGIKTITQDPNGEIIDKQDVKLKDFGSLEEIKTKLVKKFSPNYEQIVPIFSSVKIQGYKLRVLARKAEKIEMKSKKIAKFFMPDNKIFIAELPSRKVKINFQEFNGLEKIDKVNVLDSEIKSKYVLMKFIVNCSKGTYIRQLAQDIGEVFNLPSFLYSIETINLLPSGHAD